MARTEIGGTVLKEQRDDLEVEDGDGDGPIRILEGRAGLMHDEDREAERQERPHEPGEQVELTVAVTRTTGLPVTASCSR